MDENNKLLANKLIFNVEEIGINNLTVEVEIGEVNIKIFLFYRLNYNDDKPSDISVLYIER